MDVGQAALDHGTQVWAQLVSTANQGLELGTEGRHTHHTYVGHNLVIKQSETEVPKKWDIITTNWDNFCPSAQTLFPTYWQPIHENAILRT